MFNSAYGYDQIGIVHSYNINHPVIPAKSQIACDILYVVLSTIYFYDHSSFVMALCFSYIKVYIFVMTRPGRMQDADNDVNGDWPDEELQMVQKIKQFWRKLSANFANLPILQYSNLV